MIKDLSFTSLALTSAALWLTACTSFLPEPRPADIVYRLPVASAPVSPASDAAIIRMDRPVAPNTLKSDDIVVVTAGQTVARADGAVWSEAIPTLIQRSFVDTLASRPTLIGVLPNSGARPEYRISFNVRQFEADFDEGTARAPLAVADFSVTLSNAGTRELIGVFEARETQRASSNRVSDIVRAQSDANQRAQDSVADWLETLRAEGRLTT